MNAAAPVTSAPRAGWRRARAGTAAAFAAQGLLFAVLLTHLPQFKDRWGFDDTAVSLVVLLVSAAAGAGSVVAEHVARRAGSEVALRAGLVVIAAGAVGVAFASVPALGVLAFAVWGLGVGAVDAGSNMQAVVVQHAYGRSILTSFHAVWSAGGIAGAGWVALSERVHVPLATSVLAGAGAVVVLLVLAWGAMVHGAPEAVEGPLPVPWRPVLLLGAAMVCFYVADGATSNWSAVYLRDGLGASGSTAAVGYGLYQATSLLARLGGDHVVRRVGIVATVRIVAVIGVCGFVLVVVAGGPWVAAAGFAVVGLGLPVVAPLCFSAAGALAPGRADAIVARVNVFNYAGSVVGGVSVGLIGASSLRFGFLLPLVLAGALLGLARAFAVRPQVTG